MFDAQTILSEPNAMREELTEKIHAVDKASTGQWPTLKPRE